MKYQYKSAQEVITEAADMAEEYAIERLKDGDPEGSQCFRDLSGYIRKIKIRKHKTRADERKEG